MELIQERAEELHIRNSFANIASNKVVKITEIQLEDRVIRIIDTFTSVDHRPISKENFTALQIP